MSAALDAPLVGRSWTDPQFYFVWFTGVAFFQSIGNGFYAVVDDFGNLVAVRGGV